MMINAEKYKEEILEYYDKNLCTRFGVDKRTKKIIQCCSQACENCEFSVFEEKNKRTPCVESAFKWLLSEYKEPIKLSKLEYDILKYLSDNTAYLYIARESDSNILAYRFEPTKGTHGWNSRGYMPLTVFKKLFLFIKWEDEDATSIKDVLENCIVLEEEARCDGSF